MRKSNALTGSDWEMLDDLLDGLLSGGMAENDEATYQKWRDIQRKVKSHANRYRADTILKRNRGTEYRNAVRERGSR